MGHTHNLASNIGEDGGNLDVALGLAQTAKEQAPEDPVMSDTLGWIYYKKHVYTKAIGLLQETAAKLPENAVVHYHLGMAYLKNDNTDLAKQALTKALQLGRDFTGREEAREALKTLP